MKDKPFLIFLLFMGFAVGWVRENLDQVYSREIAAAKDKEIFMLLSKHGGVLGGEENRTPEEIQAFNASYTAMLRVGWGNNASDTASLATLAAQIGASERDCEHEIRREPAISTGLIFILRQMGLAELAANLLWIQMDADSHAGLWHRVHFALELIPAIDSHFTAAFLLRADMLDRVFRKYEEGIALLEKAVSYNPLEQDLYIQLGMYCLNFQRLHGPKKFPDKAIQAFVKALSLPGCPIRIQRFLAYSLAAWGKKAEGITFLEDQIRLLGLPPNEIERHRKAISRIQSGEEF